MLLALLLEFLLMPTLRNKVLSLCLYFPQIQPLWVTQHSPALSFGGMIPQCTQPHRPAVGLGCIPEVTQCAHISICALWVRGKTYFAMKYGSLCQQDHNS